MLSPADPLHTTQARFLTDLLGTFERTGEARLAVFQRPPRGTVEDRWQIYEDGFLTRIREALASEFGALLAVLGDEAFTSLVARYLERHVPRSFDLGHAGRNLAAFLESDPLCEGLPFLPALARLETAVAEVFVEAGGEPLSRSELAGMETAVLLERGIRLLPAVRLVRSSWPLPALWQLRFAPPGAEPDLALEEAPTATLVFRPAELVRCEALSAPEAALVERLLKTPGASFSTLLPEGAEGSDTAVAALAHALVRLADLQVLSR